MAHTPYESELFAKQRKELCKKNAPLEEAIEETIQKIIDNPESNDGSLRGPRAGTLKKKFAKKHYRMTFRYCSYCVAINKVRCDDCVNEGRDMDSVIFIDVFHRDDGYD